MEASENLVKEYKQIKSFNPSDRFLSLSVYKFPLGNCGGITDTITTIWIPCENGYMTYDRIEDQKTIFIPEQRGEEYWALKPIVEPVGEVGSMAGGNLAYSSDSRCKRVYHIHDRFETQKQYDSNSH